MNFKRWKDIIELKIKYIFSDHVKCKSVFVRVCPCQSISVCPCQTISVCPCQSIQNSKIQTWIIIYLCQDKL